MCERGAFAMCCIVGGGNQVLPEGPSSSPSGHSRYDFCWGGLLELSKWLTETSHVTLFLHHFDISEGVSDLCTDLTALGCLEGSQDLLPLGLSLYK